MRERGGGGFIFFFSFFFFSRVTSFLSFPFFIFFNSIDKYVDFLVFFKFKLYTVGVTHRIDQIKIGVLQKGLSIWVSFAIFFKRGSKSLLFET